MPGGAHILHVGMQGRQRRMYHLVEDGELEQLQRVIRRHGRTIRALQGRSPNDGGTEVAKCRCAVGCRFILVGEDGDPRNTFVHRKTGWERLRSQLMSARSLASHM